MICIYGNPLGLVAKIVNEIERVKGTEIEKQDNELQRPIESDSWICDRDIEPIWTLVSATPSGLKQIRNFNFWCHNLGFFSSFLGEIQSLCVAILEKEVRIPGKRVTVHFTFIIIIFLIRGSENKHLNTE